MALSFNLWSRTAASNATADPAVNWAEGQLPSTVNDSARAMMASAAGYRDDVAGAITTGGSATAYTVTSFQVFSTLAAMAGQKIAFVPHATNTNAVGVDVTLNVDGLGAKSIRMAPSIALPNGTLVLGTPYIVTYNNSDAVFYLQNMTNPYNIPLGAGMDFWGTTAPNSSFAFAFGQALSRTTYATLFTLFSTTYGVGDGSTTFNVPDKRGRISAGVDNMGGSAASRLTSASNMGTGQINQTGGTQTSTLIQSDLPNSTLSYSGSASVTGSNVVTTTSLTGIASGLGSVFKVGDFGVTATGTLTSTGSSSGSTSSINGNVTQTAFTNVQPTICCNYIIRLI